MKGKKITPKNNTCRRWRNNDVFVILRRVRTYLIIKIYQIITKQCFFIFDSHIYRKKGFTNGTSSQRRSCLSRFRVSKMWTTLKHFPSDFSYFIYIDNLLLIYSQTTYLTDLFTQHKNVEPIIIYCQNISSPYIEIPAEIWKLNLWK